MEKMNSMKNMRLLFVFLFVLVVKSHAGLAPALYIFGDSTVDVGNNNQNNFTKSKVNYSPYGIDFPAGPTGRFSNGKTTADFIADLLQIPSPPPIMGFDTKKVQTSGFNYASGSSGILDESGTQQFGGGNLNMKKQVRLFNETVGKYLPLHFNSPQNLASHLSNSIFVIVTGNNDYGLNFFNPAYNTSRIFTPESFADHLLNELGNHLEELYKLGARKYVLFEIAPLGCLPSTVAALNPQTRCVEPFNVAINLYNSKLPTKLNFLSSTLKDSTFVIAKTNKLFFDLIMHPTAYGFSDSRTPCCPMTCQQTDVACKDRNTHVFWDHSHPSEAASKIAATRCFEETNLCSPMSLRELALKR